MSIYFYCRFVKFSYTIKVFISFYPTEHSIYLPWPKWFLLSQIKIITTCSKLKSWTLRKIDTHAYVKGNWICFIYRDADPFFIRISVSHFSIETQELCLLKYDELIAFKPACLTENFTYTLQALPSANSKLNFLFAH